MALTGRKMGTDDKAPAVAKKPRPKTARQVEMLAQCEEIKKTRRRQRCAMSHDTATRKAPVIVD